MPSIVSIPDEYTEGFRDIFLLDDDEFDAIINGLTGTSLTSSIKKLSLAASSAKPSMRETVLNIFLSVGSLTSFIEKGVSIEEISHDVCIVLSDELLLEFENKDDKNFFDERLKGIFEEPGKLKLIERLSILLRTERLYYAAKANDLMFEYPNVFINAKVITDIRPIFNIKIEEAPIAGLVIHNLHIHYRGDRETEHKDIYIALDSDDLKSIKDAIIRAEKKEKSLDSVFRNSAMEHLNK